MDRRERLNDPEEATRVAQDGHQAQIWTSIPGIIQSFDPATMTAVVQPTIKGIQQLSDYSFKIVDMPLLLDVPVEFPSGGGFTLTFPIAADDECMVDFTARCFDAWWQNGGIQPQFEQRMHDLSDAVCRVGVRSKPRVLSGISTDSTQLRSEDGSTYIELKTGQLVNIVAPGGVNINGVTIDSDGNIGTPGGVTAGVGGGDQVTLQGHKHGTGAPAAGTHPRRPLGLKAMRYRALDENGDYTFGQGNANFLIDIPAAVGQAVLTRLELAKGAWFLDKDVVTPYDEILGAGTYWTADPAIRDVILNTQGVTGIAAYSSELVNRKRTVTATINTVYGQTQISQVL